MKQRTITELLAELSFFEDMPRKHLEFISGCAANAHVKEGDFIFLIGKPADHFYVIREGLVALEMEAANKIVTIQTVGSGTIVGWSWLVPPHTWHYDARAVTPVSAIRFDAACVRDKCERDPAFGYEVFKRFSRLIVERLLATRMQLTDMYN